MKQGDALSLPKGWERKTLGEVCEELFAGGDVPKDNSSKFETDNFQIPIFSNGEKNKGLYGFTNVARVTKPSITIAARGTIGYSEIREEPFYPAIRLIVIIPKTDILDLFFLKYVVSGIDFKHSGSSIPQLTVPMIKGYPIPLPPLPEQQRIVSILDKAFACIERSRNAAIKNLNNAKELFESYLQGVFDKKGEGWEEKTLGEVCEYDKTTNKRDGLTYVGLEDIQSNTGVFIGPYEPRTMKSLTFYFNGEHVLYGRLRPYLNKVLLPDFEGHCSTEIFPIKPQKSVLDRNFLFQWLIATETMKLINATWSGATLPRANMNTVLAFKINLPPLPVQRSIVQKLEALSAETKKLEAIYQQKLVDLEELKKSVLQKAFNGELSNI